MTSVSSVGNQDYYYYNNPKELIKRSNPSFDGYWLNAVKVNNTLTPGSIMAGQAANGAQGANGINGLKTGVFANPQQLQGNVTADGKDDGSIGFFGAVKNFAKGVGKFFISPFTDEQGHFSLSKTLKSAAIAGLFIAGNALTGGALTPILLTVGGAAGAFGMAKAGYNIATAKTDAEAEAAWQSMGSSTATVATAVVGAKSYAKGQAIKQGQAPTEASEAYSGPTGTLKAMKDTAVDAGQNVKAGYKFTKGKLADGYHAIKTSYKNGTLKSDAKAIYNNVKTTAKDAYDMAKEVKTANKEAWARMSKEQKKEAINNIKKAMINTAKSKIGSTPKEVLTTAKKAATAPITIGINTNLGRQTIQPDFESQLTPEQRAIFDKLSDEQKEQLIKAAYQQAA